MTGLNGFYQMFDCDLEDTAVGPKWNEWVKELDNYLKWINITDDERKKAALLHHAGVEVFRIYEALEKNSQGDDGAQVVDSIDDMKKKLANHFNPIKNRYYEKHIFRNAKQEEGESIASYATRLRNLSKYCGFQDVDSEIMSQITEGSNNKDVIGKILRSNDELKLEELLDWGRTREVANYQIKDITTSSGTQFTVNKISYGNHTGHVRRCYSCGLKFPHIGECPAKHRKCNKCGVTGNFEKRCRQEVSQNKKSDDQVNSINKLDSNEYDYYAFSIKGDDRLPRAEVMVNNNLISFMIDTSLLLISLMIYPYKSIDPLPMLGEFETEITWNGIISRTCFRVVKGEADCLLCFKTAMELGIINMVNKLGQYEQLKSQYPKLFSNKIGKLKDYELDFHVDEQVKPKKQFHSRIPFHLRKQVEEELKSLLDQDIIEKADGPTTRISPIHVVPKKNGKIRIVVNAKQVNNAIKRESHICPTVDDLVHKLNGASWFGKLDFNHGYRQIVLS
ncbi:unnamed protein product [Brachionus calyciflorus]|uniref:Uncharacterized protein n=1 Tax=Brachionus calyciflorus TaxID=104777 RepID=A0A813M4K7_9BILA|nr:unnamed protein product [Brachionus calyciflorus]